MKKIISVLLLIAMMLTLLPTGVIAAKNEQAVEVSAKAMNKINEDVWSAIEAYEAEKIVAKRGEKITAKSYAKISHEIENLVKKTDTYVEGTINRNGDFFTWETTEGIVCGYSPELRYRERNVDRSAIVGGENISTTSYATKGGTPDGKNVYLISPYYNDSYSADSSFTNQYKNEGKSIASATGGSFTQYGYTQATVTNVAKAIQSGAVVLFDSHGITDYSNGEDYVSRANSSYLCLNTGTGITSTDQKAVSGTYGTYYHAFNGGSSTWCVDGTAMSNHMSANAPHSIVWMAICLGMATKGLQAPLRAKGVEVVYGYSQSVSFTGDYKYEASFWNSMKAGKTVAQACSTMKSSYGKWDPAYSSYSESSARANYVAFPIVASSEDTYPGQGKVDAVQTVKSTWTLFQEDSSSSGSGSDSGNTGSNTGSSSSGTDNTYELVTSSSGLTAGKYIVLAAADGNYAGNYGYYAMTTSGDSSYAAMSAEGLSFSSLPESITCAASGASAYEWTVAGSRTSFTMAANGQYLVSASGSTKLALESSSTTWAGTYGSSAQGFRVKGNSRYISLRDDISTTGANGNPLFCTVSSTSSGTTYLHFYKLTSSGSSSSGSGTTTCSHSSTTSSTTAATCTTAGKTTVTCKTCGAVVSTTPIAALGHNYKYTSSNNGSHKITCSRCSYSTSASCTYSSNVCKYCGYTKPSTDSGSTSTSAITSGQYVIAAKIGSTYYAMSNAFASKITGSKITVTNGKVAADDAEGYVVNITKNGSNYTIDNGSKYLKYSSSTNFASSTSAYNWTIGAGKNGSYRITASTATTRGIIFYKSTTKFGAYALSNASATSTTYYDVEILPISGSSSSGSGSNSGSTDTGSTSGTYTYELVTSASGLTAGSYIVIAAADGTYAGDYNYYALTTGKDGSYAAMSASGLNLSSLPSKLTCDASSVSAFEWTLTGSRTSFKLATGNSYLAGASGSTKLTISSSATTWAGTYSSSYQGFRVKGNSRYISLRDDISTAGDNGNPLFCTVSSTGSGTTYLHFYKLVNG